MKLDSVALTSIFAGPIPTNLAKSQTPAGKWQAVRVLAPGGPKEGEFDLLWEGDSEQECDALLRRQVEHDFPGLLQQ